MAHVKPTGSFVALVTPMNRDGSIDTEGFRDLLQFHETHGTRAVLIMGSTGEVSMLSPEERRQIVAATVKMKTEGLALYYGCTGNDTATTIDMVRYAKGGGCRRRHHRRPPRTSAPPTPPSPTTSRTSATPSICRSASTTTPRG